MYIPFSQLQKDAKICSQLVGVSLFRYVPFGLVWHDPVLFIFNVVRLVICCCCPCCRSRYCCCFILNGCIVVILSTINSLQLQSAFKQCSYKTYPPDRLTNSRWMGVHFFFGKFSYLFILKLLLRSLFGVTIIFGFYFIFLILFSLVAVIFYFIRFSFIFFRFFFLIFGWHCKLTDFRRMTASKQLENINVYYRRIG